MVVGSFGPKTGLKLVEPFPKHRQPFIRPASKSISLRQIRHDWIHLPVIRAQAIFDGVERCSIRGIASSNRPTCW